MKLWTSLALLVVVSVCVSLCSADLEQRLYAEAINDDAIVDSSLNAKLSCSLRTDYSPSGYFPLSGAALPFIFQCSDYSSVFTGASWAFGARLCDGTRFATVAIADESVNAALRISEPNSGQVLFVGADDNVRYNSESNLYHIKSFPTTVKYENSQFSISSAFKFPSTRDHRSSYRAGYRFGIVLRAYAPNGQPLYAQVFSLGWAFPSVDRLDFPPVPPKFVIGYDYTEYPLSFRFYGPGVTTSSFTLQANANPHNYTGPAPAFILGSKPSCTITNLATNAVTNAPVTAENNRLVVQFPLVQDRSASYAADCSQSVSIRHMLEGPFAKIRPDLTLQLQIFSDKGAMFTNYGIANMPLN